MTALQRIQEASTLVQGSREWYQAKLGCFSSSGVHALMGTEKAATTYIYKVAAERNLKEKYRDEYFSEYLKRTSVSSKAMEYGKENEDLARTVYMMKTGNTIAQCGFIMHPEIPFFGDSPDGIILDESQTRIVGTLEIKVPNPDTYLKYKVALKSGVSLKDLESKYYWQIVTHVMCNGVEYCDFVVFDKMQNKGLHIEKIYVPEFDKEALRRAIEKANNKISKILNN